MKKNIIITVLFIFCITIFAQEQSVNNETTANTINNTKEVIAENTEKLPAPAGDSITEKGTESISTEDEANREMAEPEEEIKRPGTSLFELYKLGGVFMWPLLIFSILVLAVIIERAIVFASFKFNIKKTCEPAIKHLNNKDFNKAVSVFKENDKCFATDLFAKSIAFLEKNKIKEFEKHIETSSTVKIAQLERNQNILSAMGNIAPLTGFLGTVSGMIAAFKTIALSDNVTARLVAGGIYEALITTAFGLIIAIAAVAANNFFVHKIDNAANEITECANLMIECISE